MNNTLTAAAVIALTACSQQATLMSQTLVTIADARTSKASYIDTVERGDSVGDSGDYTNISGNVESVNNRDGTFTQTLRYRTD